MWATTRTGGEAAPRLLTAPFALTFGVSVLSNLVVHTYLHFAGFLAERGASDAFVGTAMGFLGLAGILGRPFVGRFMDARGRRDILRVGLALHLVACVAYLGVQGPGLYVFFVRFLHGLAVASTIPVLFTMAADLAPDGRKTEAIALFGTSGLAPLAGGGLLGDAVLATWGYHELFALTAVLAGGALALGLAIPDSRAGGGGEPARSFTATATARELLPVWFIGVTFSLALSSAFFFVKRFVQDTEVGSVGLFFSAYAAAAIALRFGLAWLPERLGPKRVLLPALLVVVAGLALLSRADDARDLVLAGACAGLGHGFAFPITVGLAVSRSRPAERGVAMSLATATFDAGMLLGGFTFGALLEATDYATTFAAAAALAFVGLVVFVWLDRGR